MSKDESLPEPLAEPVDDADRVAAIGRLHELVGPGSLSLELFSSALEQVLAATTNAELELAMKALPSLIHLTRASRRLEEPLEVRVGYNILRLGAGWQLAAHTSVRVATGICVIDLSQASWDATEVDLHLRTATGVIDVIVPEGVAIQMLSVSGQLKLRTSAPAIPGGPLLRITSHAATGFVRIRHPKLPRGGIRRRWMRRVR